MDDEYALVAGADTVVPAANGILVNDTVPCSSAVTITVTKQPTHGTLTAPTPRLAPRRGMAGGGFTYTPNNLAQPDADFYEYTINCNGMVSFNGDTS